VTTIIVPQSSNIKDPRNRRKERESKELGEGKSLLLPEVKPIELCTGLQA